MPGKSLHRIVRKYAFSGGKDMSVRELRGTPKCTVENARLAVQF